jgi:hypothetical protein
MKPLSGMLLSSALVVALGCAVGCNSATSTPVPTATAANLQSVVFFVDGMI